MSETSSSNEPPSSPVRLLALHGLRLKGVAPAERVARLYHLAEAEVEEQYRAEPDLVLLREGRLAGWALTKAGRVEGESLVRSELADVGGRDAVHASYLLFHDHNQAMLKLCTDWQLVPTDGEPQLNDHDDANYDASVIERLAAHHDSVAPVLPTLTAALDRFAVYGRRFEAALGKLAVGEADYFTKPVIDSYHTVWFELHEDLLATLGIERSTEADYHAGLSR